MAIYLYALEYEGKQSYGNISERRISKWFLLDFHHIEDREPAMSFGLEGQRSKRIL